MKLDFNFKLNDSNGFDAGVAHDTLVRILDKGNNSDDTYLKKIGNWTKDIKKTGIIDVDEIDAQQLYALVSNCPFTFNFAKIALRNYIEKRIEQSKSNGKKK
jgi:hypothetical protein